MKYISGEAKKKINKPRKNRRATEAGVRYFCVQVMMCPDIAISSGLDDEKPESVKQGRVRRGSVVSRRLPSSISGLTRDITSISELLQFVSSWPLRNTCSRLNIMIEGDISRRYYLFVQRKTRVFESPFLLPSLKTTTLRTLPHSLEFPCRLKSGVTAGSRTFKTIYYPL